MTVFKYFPILLMIGTIAIYSTGNYASDASTVNKTSKASVVTVKASAVGENKQKALENAEAKAFEELLFEGIQGNSQVLPLIADEEKFKAENKEYYDLLITKKGYKNYIQSLEVEHVKGLMGKKNFEMALKVNLEALKTDLRKNNIKSIEL